MASSIEFFDRATLAHRRTQVLPPLGGSLTWIERREGAWWAGVANYDWGGGEPGRDHRFSFVLKLDATFRPVSSWRFPDAVLARFAPSSCSGGSWGDDGLLYVSGHDKPELYALRLPRAGATLELVAITPIATEGQAISSDRSAPRTLWSIRRSVREMAASQLPNVVGHNGTSWSRTEPDGGLRDLASANRPLLLPLTRNQPVRVRPIQAKSED